MKIYLAASFTSQGAMKSVRKHLVSYGHTVTSRWLDQKLPKIDQFDGEHLVIARSAAVLDMTDIAAADIVVIFTKPASTTGGMHVELGLALAQSKKIVIVGPYTNIFQTLPDVQVFGSMFRFLAHMKKESQDAGSSIR